MSLVNLEYADKRDAYVRYGAAMYQCQSVERRLALLLATTFGPEPDETTREEFEELLSSLYGKTFGRLIRHFRKSGVIPAELESRLEKALSTRNWLAHDYFFERAVDVCHPEKRVEMVKELREAESYLYELEQELRRLGEGWRIKHGITEDMIQEEEERLLGR